MSENKVFEEVREILSPHGIARVSEPRKMIVDKKTGQFIIKIPRVLGLRAGFNENTKVHMVLRPNNNTYKKVAETTEFLIYFEEEEENGEKSKNTKLKK